VVKGDDSIHTAMAKTVGLPLAIASARVLNKQLSKKGVVLPWRRNYTSPFWKN
jgi:saccharopine dehydrogenase (NAD+, L-glutamate forming)